MGEQAKKTFIINVIFISIWVGIILVAGKFLFQYMFPFVIAVLVATFMQKPARFLSERTHIKKSVWATVLSAVLYILLALMLGYGVLKVLSLSGRALSSVSGFANSALEVINKFRIFISGFLSDISPETQNAGEKIISSVVDSITDKLSVFFSDTAAVIIKTAPSFLFSSVVALAATCYIAKDFDRLIIFFKNLLGEKRLNSAKKVWNILKTSVFKIITGYLILMVITFVELCVGFVLLRMERWFLIAVLVALVDALPVLGAGAVLIPWGLGNIILGNRVLGAGLSFLYLVITVIRNFIEPKIVGDKTGINPLFILLTLFSGLRLFGFLGLIIFPVTFIVVVKYYKNEMELN